jgi:UDP-GlcNAc:undecaprenyl-phosphate GlcNAc-1-phosphate transferase
VGAYFLVFFGFISDSTANASSNVLAIIMVPASIIYLANIRYHFGHQYSIVKGQSPAQGGTDHTSHRLIAFGLSEKQAVLTLYAVAFISGISAAALEALDYELSLILIPWL